MKIKAFFLPATTLVLGTIWMASQISGISDLENEIVSLKRRIKSSPQASSTLQSGMTRRTPLDHSQISDINWSRVAGEFSEGHGRFGIFKTSLKLEDQLRQLSATELIEALDAIEKQGLSEEEVKSLTNRLLGLLLDVDPAHLLKFPSKDPRVAELWLQLQNPTLAMWAKDSPDDAVKWLDEQSNENLSIKQRSRLEKTLISSLMVSDFALARARFTKLAPEDRRKFFTNFESFGISWSQQDFESHNITGRFADMIRLAPGELPNHLISPLTWIGDQDRPAGISAIQESLKGWKDKPHGGLSHQVIDDYFGKIKPTRAEFESGIEILVNESRVVLPDRPTLEGEALRTWLIKELSTHIRES